MAAAERETQRLRELHEFYICQVNAAVEAGRDDLVAELADEYLEDAIAELTSEPSTPPAAPDPAPLDVRAEVLAVGPSRTARRWWRRARTR